MRYWAAIDGDTAMLFRTPDAGGPPTELYDPATGTWAEEVSLIDFFTGDETGVTEVPADAVPTLMEQM